MKSLKYIQLPHLPQGKVGLIMAGERYRKKLESPLLSTCTEVLWLPDNPCVDARLAGHSDLSVLHMGGNTLIAESKFPSIVNTLTILGFKVKHAKNEQKSDYPGDCGLNGCFVGQLFLHKASCTDPAVTENMPANTTIININQGYAKCSICVVDEHGIITADAGAAKAAAAHGIETLLISPGFIRLDGFDSGFIGGSTFKLSRDKLAFTGTLDEHPDKDRILAFIRSRGIEPVFLTDEPIFDIGSAIPLLEQ